MNDLIDANCDVSFESVTEIDDIPKRNAQNNFHFTKEHSLHDSHASHLISNYEKRVPNFIGANYQDAIKVTVNITVAPCLHFLNHGKEVMT